VEDAVYPIAAIFAGALLNTSATISDSIYDPAWREKTEEFVFASGIYA
jgi:hypothetical protein